MTRGFASALSEHPLTAHATGEVVGQVLEAVGLAPELAVVFVTSPHAGAIEDVANVVREVLQPQLLLGATAVSVLAGEREVEGDAAVVLFAARLPSPAEPVRLEVVPSGDGWQVAGLPDAVGDDERVLLLLPDPFSFPADQFLDLAHQQHPGLRVVGGLASAANGPGGNRLVLGPQIHTDGAVGALLPASTELTTVVSQGCRPIGDPVVVTKAERNVIYELAGKPALEKLVGLLHSLPPEDRALAQGGIHVGRVIDEHKAEFGRGDFLIRNVLGGDREVGAIPVGDELDVGTVVQFQVRDADSADDDLRLLLSGRAASGALVFTCNGRGMHLFGQPDHDASVVTELTGAATAGMFCAGELGPIGGRNFLHGFTASVLLFR